jgi:CheY-like chemotaxis protein
MTTASSESDFFRCYWCAALNDVSDPQWCLCATNQPTLVCSKCGRCSCEAPAAYVRTFWRLASPRLVAERWRAVRGSGRSAGVPTVDGELLRPVILVVDDDRVVHSVIDRILVGFPGTVLHANDGHEALRLARAVGPELLLIDALLPKLDGRAVALALKADPGTAHIRTVIMTALYKGQRYRSEAFREFMVDEYLEKPVSAPKLREVVDRLLAVRLSGEPVQEPVREQLERTERIAS